MANIKPFKAVRYAPGIKLADVVTQPYDKIPPSLWQTYKARDPHNLVNLILPDETAAAAKEISKYELSAELFNQWLGTGVLARDGQPGFYPYRQTFDIFGQHHVRSGFIGLLHVEDYAKRIVFPHEKTLSKPKADRLSLLRAGRVHYGLIFLLYEDDGSAQRILNQSMMAMPVGGLTDDFRVQNELWQMSDPAMIEGLQQALVDKQMFIADGHHRYETSLNYAKENPNDLDAQFTLAMFINVNSPLVVLPTHRVVHSLPKYDRATMRAVLGKNFTLKPCGTLKETIAATQAPVDQVCIGCFDGKEYFAATLKDGAAMQRAVPGKSDAWRALDVAVLHALVIEQALGMTPEMVEQETGIHYVRDAQEAADTVAGGKAQCVFFLRGTRPAQVCEVARNGEVMPQKSTDFYPKLLSGMAMYGLDLQV